MKPQDAATERSRFTSLDGLRGVAALTVVFHHSLLVVPELASGEPGDVSAVAHVLKFSPLHGIWLGSEAVWLFFILSGFVLALPYLRTRKLDLASYYPRRLIRIYVPALAALAFAFLLAQWVARPGASSSEWMQIHQAQSVGDTLRDAALIFGGSQLNTPLWSLQWEVLYSLVLPVALLAFARSHRWWWATAAALFVLIVLGALADVTALFLMPMFVLGCVFAANWDMIHRYATAALSSSHGALIGWAAIVGSAVLLTLKWTLMPLGLPGAISSAAQGGAIFGIVIIFILAVTWQPLRAFLTKPVVQWLGTVSFSLYLVHEPVVVAVGVLVGPDMAYLALPIALPLSLVLGWVFYLLVEKPSHRLSQRVGRAIRQRAQREGEPQTV